MTATENLFRVAGERSVVLTPNEEKAVLALDSSYQSIIRAEYFDNYDLPCPVLVEVATDAGPVQVVLRKTRHGDVKKEVRVLRALKEFGLPVPEVLHEPFSNEHEEAVALYSLLPGENLQKLSMRSENDLALAKDLLIQAVSKLAEASVFIAQHDVAAILPQRTLTSELEEIKASDTPWLQEKAFQAALRHLEGAIMVINTPLVLSNGDYQPGNFLAKDGRLTGFLDFESPSFRDPLMGFVKYPIYDLVPLSRTDLVESFLKQTGFSTQDFNIRLALGCLKVLQKEIPVAGGDVEMQEYHVRVVSLLEQALKTS